MDDLNVTAADLPRMEKLGEVSSYRQGKDAWTVLGLYYREGYNRPVVAVVEGWKISEMGKQVRFAFKQVCVGTIDRALNWFDESELMVSLRAQVADIHVLPAAKLPAAAALRLLGYAGPERLTDAMEWLMPEHDLPRLSDNPSIGRPLLLEQHFGIGQRNVNNALAAERDGQVAPGPWVRPFITALRFFDRAAWLETIVQSHVDTMTTEASSPARSSKGNPHASQPA